VRPRVAVFKYGVGNIYSISSGVRRAGGDPVVVTSAEELVAADPDAVILPGVGCFDAAMKRIGERGAEAIRGMVEEGRPLLGICLGLQLLYEWSEESIDYSGKPLRGLGLLRGTVKKMKARKLPHIGWTRVRILRRCRLLRGVRDGTYMYFIHSYAVPYREGDETVCATARHGETVFVAAVEKPPVYATQFHPEKSSREGLKVLRNFIEVASERRWRA